MNTIKMIISWFSVSELDQREHASGSVVNGGREESAILLCAESIERLLDKDHTFVVR